MPAFRENIIAFCSKLIEMGYISAQHTINLFDTNIMPLDPITVFMLKYFQLISLNEENFCYVNVDKFDHWRNSWRSYAVHLVILSVLITVLLVFLLFSYIVMRYS